MRKIVKSILYANNFHLQEELRGIADYARAHGWQLAIPQAFGLAEYMRHWNGVGILTDTGLYAEELTARGVKVVGLSMEPALLRHAAAVVAPDNERIGQLCADYFLQRGFRYFAVCADVFQRDTAFQERIGRQGFQATVLNMPRFLRTPADQLVLQRQLRRLPRPCAVFLNNDYEAFSVLTAAAEAGLKVPDDLSVVGVGNDELTCTTALPTLSSLDTRLYERGWCAAQELDRLLEGGTPREAPIVIAPGEMVERQSSNAFSVRDRRLRRLVEYLQKHSAEPLLLAQVARRFRLAEPTLYRLFKAEFGMGAKEFLMMLRLSLAKTLLRDTSDKISAIALACGFPSQTALFALFRQRYGMTPDQWRGQNRRNGND